MKNIHKILKNSNPANAQMAFLIERGEMNAFLIASEAYKKYDQFVKQFIKDDMSKQPKPYDYEFKETDIDFKIKQPTNIQINQHQQNIQHLNQQHIQNQNNPQNNERQAGSTGSGQNDEKLNRQEYTITSRKIIVNGNSNNPSSVINNPNARQPINKQNAQKQDTNKNNQQTINLNSNKNTNSNNQKDNKK